jgi:hypothetical protein
MYITNQYQYILAASVFLAEVGYVNYLWILVALAEVSL